MKLFKIILILFGSLLILIISTLLYDLAYYDPSYINRNAITFSVNNLNSKKIRKLFIYYDKLFYKIGYKFSNILLHLVISNQQIRKHK